MKSCLCGSLCVILWHDFAILLLCEHTLRHHTKTTFLPREKQKTHSNDVYRGTTTETKQAWKVVFETVDWPKLLNSTFSHLSLHIWPCKWIVKASNLPLNKSGMWHCLIVVSLRFLHLNVSKSEKERHDVHRGVSKRKDVLRWTEKLNFLFILQLFDATRRLICEV